MDRGAGRRGEGRRPLPRLGGAPLSAPGPLDPSPTDRSPPRLGPAEVGPPVTPARVVAGGVLMGVANLVPGVSGGTMILALGLYDRFIESVAEVARLRPTVRSVTFLGLLATGLAAAVLTLAGPAVWLVQELRWLAYSVFIGLTLGGAPLLWRVVRPLDAGVGLSVAAGLGVMAALAFGLPATVLSPTPTVFVLAGALAASSMILPGVSGSYVLLILGLYDRVVGSLRPAALQSDPAGSLGVIVPVGIGAVLGIALLSNVLKVVLVRFERASHGVLLGLLLGSVLGLWPFQRAVEPPTGDPDRVELVRYRPSPGQAAGAAGVLVLGFALTLALGGVKPRR